MFFSILIVSHQIGKFNFLGIVVVALTTAIDAIHVVAPVINNNGNYDTTTKRCN